MIRLIIFMVVGVVVGVVALVGGISAHPTNVTLILFGCVLEATVALLIGSIIYQRLKRGYFPSTR